MAYATHHVPILFGAHQRRAELPNKIAVISH
jgi:hypothetical protein